MILVKRTSNEHHSPVIRVQQSPNTILSQLHRHWFLSRRAPFQPLSSCQTEAFKIIDCNNKTAEEASEFPPPRCQIYLATWVSLDSLKITKRQPSTDLLCRWRATLIFMQTAAITVSTLTRFPERNLKLLRLTRLLSRTNNSNSSLPSPKKRWYSCLSLDKNSRTSSAVRAND